MPRPNSSLTNLAISTTDTALLRLNHNSHFAENHGQLAVKFSLIPKYPNAVSQKIVHQFWALANGWPASDPNWQVMPSQVEISSWPGSARLCRAKCTVCVAVKRPQIFLRICPLRSSLEPPATALDFSHAKRQNLSRCDSIKKLYGVKRLGISAV